MICFLSIIFASPSLIADSGSDCSSNISNNGPTSYPGSDWDWIGAASYIQCNPSQDKAMLLVCTYAIKKALNDNKAKVIKNIQTKLLGSANVKFSKALSDLIYNSNMPYTPFKDSNKNDTCIRASETLTSSSSSKSSKKTSSKSGSKSSSNSKSVLKDIDFAKCAKIMLKNKSNDEFGSLFTDKNNNHNGYTNDLSSISNNISKIFTTEFKKKLESTLKKAARKTFKQYGYHTFFRNSGLANREVATCKSGRYIGRPASRHTCYAVMKYTNDSASAKGYTVGPLINGCQDGQLIIDKSSIADNALIDFSHRTIAAYTKKIRNGRRFNREKLFNKQNWKNIKKSRYKLLDSWAAFKIEKGNSKGLYNVTYGDALYENQSLQCTKAFAKYRLETLRDALTCYLAYHNGKQRIVITVKLMKAIKNGFKQSLGVLSDYKSLKKDFKSISN